MMKKILSVLICLCSLGALGAAAAAEETAAAPEESPAQRETEEDIARTPSVIAVYAAANARTDKNGEPSATLRYVYDDGTYKQYAMHGGSAEIVEQGKGDLSDKPGPGFVRIYPPQTESALTPVQSAGGTAAAPGDDAEKVYDEGTDTGIRITAYTQYAGAHADYFPVPGDKIAVISPSALPGETQAAATVEGLRSWGFEPVLGKHVFGELRTLDECLEDLRWALEDPEIEAIFCVRGGYGATEVLDAFGTGRIAQARKPIIGYSDITAYHGAWTVAGLPSVHASMSAAFEDFPAACAEAEQHMLTGKIPAYECDADAYCRPGTAEGVLIGGNLSTFTAALDTAYDCTIPDRPYILFLEEVGENMQHIHRYLTILKHRGVLDHAAGIVFGEWTELPADGLGNYGNARGGLFASTADMITRQLLGGTDIPVAFGFPAGHGEINYPLLMGATARLEVSEDRYTLSWPEEGK